VLMGGTAKADPTPTGLELGLRSGYAIPLGAATGGGTNGSNDLSKLYNGAIPIWVDAGYRLNPNLFIGAFFQYGIGLLNTSSSGAAQGCSTPGVSCSGNDMKFGAQVHYHLMPDQTIDPWAGLGIGYEIASYSASAGGQSAGASFSGFQFVDIQAGADYKVMPNLGVGPFIDFSLGQFSSCSFSGAASAAGGSCSIPQKAMHEWFTIGVKGSYDINL
ncbi:MAG: hypothetical protein ACRELB_05865, partial [Polyangiaceae bacterium]